MLAAAGSLPVKIIMTGQEINRLIAEKSRLGLPSDVKFPYRLRCATAPGLECPSRDLKGDPNQGQANPANPNQGQANPANPNQGQANPANPNQGQANPANPNQGQANPANPNQGQANPLSGLEIAVVDIKNTSNGGGRYLCGNQLN